jgi:hypothetical protein
VKYCYYIHQRPTNEPTNVVRCGERRAREALHIRLASITISNRSRGKAWKGRGLEPPYPPKSHKAPLRSPTIWGKKRKGSRNGRKEEKIVA